MIGGCLGVVATVVAACVLAFVGLDIVFGPFTSGGSADVEWRPKHAAEVCASSFSSNRHEIGGLDDEHTGPAWVRGSKGGNCYVRIEGIGEYESIPSTGWHRASAPIEFDGPPNAHVGRFSQIAVR